MSRYLVPSHHHYPALPRIQFMAIRRSMSCMLHITTIIQICSPS
uniref:Uncharacterized protein n=1 Tax=Rhizophora mucronata TaxID=61149 RepID=A0A2P2LQ84_RHIMU